jgi:hypothetical protein
VISARNFEDESTEMNQNFFFPKRQVFYEFKQNYLVDRGKQAEFASRIWQASKTSQSTLFTRLISTKSDRPQKQADENWFKSAAEKMKEFANVSVGPDDLFWQPTTDPQEALYDLEKKGSVVSNTSWWHDLSAFGKKQSDYWHIHSSLWTFQQEKNRKNLTPENYELLLNSVSWCLSFSYSMGLDGYDARKWLRTCAREIKNGWEQKKKRAFLESTVLADLHHNHAFIAPTMKEVYPAFENWEYSGEYIGEILAEYKRAALDAEIASESDSSYRAKIQMNRLCFATTVLQVRQDKVSSQQKEEARRIIQEYGDQSTDLPLDNGAHVMAAKFAMAKRDGAKDCQISACEEFIKNSAARTDFDKERILIAKSNLFGLTKKDEFRSAAEAIVANKTHQARDRHLLDLPSILRGLKSS